MEREYTLLETLVINCSLWGDGVVHLRWTWQDSDVANDLQGRLRIDSDDSLGDAADEMGRVLSGWAALGRLGMVRTMMRQS